MPGSGLFPFDRVSPHCGKTGFIPQCRCSRDSPEHQPNTPLRSVVKFDLAVTAEAAEQFRPLQPPLSETQGIRTLPSHETASSRVGPHGARSRVGYPMAHGNYNRFPEPIKRTTTNHENHLQISYDISCNRPAGSVRILQLRWNGKQPVVHRASFRNTRRKPAMPKRKMMQHSAAPASAPLFRQHSINR